MSVNDICIQESSIDGGQKYLHEEMTEQKFNSCEIDIDVIKDEVILNWDGKGRH